MTLSDSWHTPPSNPNNRRSSVNSLSVRRPKNTAIAYPVTEGILDITIQFENWYWDMRIDIRIIDSE